MGEVHIIDEQSLSWSLSHEKERPGAHAGDNPRVRYKQLTEGETAAPRSLLIEYPPGHYEPAHSHPHDEVLYIMEGSCRIGDRDVGAGTYLFIERDTKYGPLVSDGGMRFLRVQTSP